MNQIVDSRAIAIVRTRLPYTDRRALSQAWFSALHLASDEPAKLSPRRAPGDAPAAPAPHGGGACAAEASPLGTARAIARALRRAAEPAPPCGPASRAAATERPRTPNPPSEELTRPRTEPPFRSALTFGVAGDRVQLLLRRDGGVLHVVALCRPEVEGIVRRALALAGAFVRLQGDSLRACVHTLAEDPR